jgi:hypothetical protein
VTTTSTHNEETTMNRTELPNIGTSTVYTYTAADNPTPRFSNLVGGYFADCQVCGELNTADSAADIEALATAHVCDTDEFTTTSQDQATDLYHRIHTFTTNSGRAYDLTQTDRRFKHGDVLVIPSEGVVGVLNHAWPTAVTVESGSLDRLVEGASPIVLLEDEDNLLDAAALATGLAVAVKIAQSLDLAVRA